MGYEVAAALGCELDLLLVRKVGTPGHEELAMGAVAEGDVTVIHDPVVAAAGVSEDELEAAITQARVELELAASKYRTRPVKDISGHCAVIVDDGLATGSTARAGVDAARARGAREVWVTAPVAPPSTVGELERFADRVVVVQQPLRFMAVGAWYRDFTQVNDGEVRRLIAEAG